MLDDAEHLVTDHELGCIVGRPAESALDQLTVGAAYTGLKHANLDIGRSNPGQIKLGEMKRMGGSGIDCKTRDTRS